jgi:hypothetical protein
VRLACGALREDDLVEVPERLAVHLPRGNRLRSIA